MFKITGTHLSRTKQTKLHKLWHNKRHSCGNVTPQNRTVTAQLGNHLTDLERLYRMTWCKSMVTIHRNDGYLPNLHGVGVGLYFSVFSKSFVNTSGDTYSIAVNPLNACSFFAIYSKFFNTSKRAPTIVKNTKKLFSYHFCRSLQITCRLQSTIYFSSFFGGLPLTNFEPEIHKLHDFL